jgi:hypothetical protein
VASGSIYTPSDYGLGSAITYKELDVFLADSYEGKPRKESVASIYHLSVYNRVFYFTGFMKDIQKPIKCNLNVT